MSNLPEAWPRGIYSTTDVRGFDRHAIDDLGIRGFELMTRAGQAALELVQRRWPDAGSLLIYCGAGNNAGDGYVLARLAAQAGLDVRVLAAVDPGRLEGDAAEAHARAVESGIAIEAFDDKAETPAAPRADLVVDALLGTGLTRDLDGVFAAAVEAINRHGRPVLALDVPSGLDADTGHVRGTAVEADATITFVALKAGLYLGRGPDYRGELAFSALGLPPETYEGVAPKLRRLDPADRRSLLKPRSRMSHKGMNGKVLIVGGSVGMAGAARMAAEAALRAGAGLVHAAVHPDVSTAAMAGRPEIMCRGVEHLDDFDDWIQAADAVVLGPGLGRDAWARGLAEAVLPFDRPLVVDADGLNLLAEQPLKRERWAITPHPGEASRLLSREIRDVQAARDEAAVALARRYGAVAVLKGACSLIAQPDEEDSVALAVADYGNPGMASGGMGDILSGVVGALIAQFGFSAEAVELAVLVHALAGDDAAHAGERGMIASDLLPHIRRRVNPG